MAAKTRMFVPAMGRINTQNRDGSEVRLSALLSLWARKYEVFLFMPNRQEKVFKTQRVPLERMHCLVQSEVINSEKETTINAILTYLLRMLRAIWYRYPKQVDVIYCPSDFLFDLVPALFCKFANPKAQLFVCIFLLAPNPFFGSSHGVKSQNKKLNLRSFLYFVSQHFSLFLIKVSGAFCLTLNQIDFDSLAIDQRRKKKVTMGISLLDNQRLASCANKTTDAIFVGRLHPQKGLPELLLIAQEVKCQKPDLSIIIVGGGDERVVNWLNTQIKNRGLENNVKYLGFKSGQEKDKLIANSRVFLMTSNYESFGSTVIEAMSLGTEVVAFKLPVFLELFEDKISMAEIGDICEYARLVSEKLIASKTVSSSQVPKEFLDQFDWEKIAAKELIMPPQGV